MPGAPGLKLGQHGVMIGKLRLEFFGIFRPTRFGSRAEKLEEGHFLTKLARTRWGTSRPFRDPIFGDALAEITLYLQTVHSGGLAPRVGDLTLWSSSEYKLFF